MRPHKELSLSILLPPWAHFSLSSTARRLSRFRFQLAKLTPLIRAHSFLSFPALPPSLPYRRVTARPLSLLADANPEKERESFFTGSNDSRVLRGKCRIYTREGPTHSLAIIVGLPRIYRGAW